MTSEPHAFFTLDAGSATLAAALIARVDGRWRLLAADAAPVGIPGDVLLRGLVDQVHAARPEALPDPAGWPDWTRVESRTWPPPRVVIAGPSDRSTDALARAFAADGWNVGTGITPERAGALEAAIALRDPGLDLVAVAAPDGLGGHEHEALLDVLALVGATAGLRDDLPVLVAGRGGSGRPDLPAERVRRTHGAGDAVPAARELVGRRRDGWSNDGRDAFVRSIASLAAVLDLRVEGVDVGLDAGTRVMAGPDGVMRRLVRADAALVPPEAVDDQRFLDAIARWSPLADDAFAIRDRLRNLRVAPWRDAAGDGARLRLAAARASLERLDAAWHDPARERHHDARGADRLADPVPLTAPDLVVVSGGAFAVPPAPAVALAIVDILRRPGAMALALDHARVLAPLGTIESEPDRRRMLADLADDILLPLGSVVVAPGLRAGHRGTLRVTADGASTSLPLTPGAVQVVDLPPGLSAAAELESPDDLFVGVRARRALFRVTGGLGGLLVDTRDMPLRLPDRPERRREFLDTWQRPFWTTAEP